MSHAKNQSEKSKTRRQQLSDEHKKSHPFTFVNIPLSSEDREVIVESAPDYERIAQWVFGMTYSGGYKVGISYNSKDGCFVIAVTGTLYTRDDYNRCVTSRHPDFEVAVCTAMYKHSQYCSEGIPAPEQRQESGFIFD